MTLLSKKNTQLNIPFPEIKTNSEISSSKNTIAPHDEAFHNWYRFVLSYPPHLVRQYFQSFGLLAGQTVLDPFCGTGTTIVEAKLNDLNGIGLEANPLAHFVSSVKINWKVDPLILINLSLKIADETKLLFATQGIDDQKLIFNGYNKLRQLDEEVSKLLIKNSISVKPLHKSLILRDIIDEHKNVSEYPHLRLALAKALVFLSVICGLVLRWGLVKSKMTFQLFALGYMKLSEWPQT